MIYFHSGIVFINLQVLASNLLFTSLTLTVKAKVMAQKFIRH